MLRLKSGARNVVAATDSSATGAVSIKASVWRMLAERLANGAYEGQEQDLLRAAERLLGEASWDRLFDGGATSRLALHARTVRVFGPVGSGKTTCASRIVRQAIADGRHATVFHSSAFANSAEYVFGDVTAAALNVINAES